MSDDPVLHLEHKLVALVARASADHALLEAGDKVMVAVSGGKDSLALLHLLRLVQRRAPFRFELLAVNVDIGLPGFPKDLLPDYFEREGYDWRVVNEEIYSVVQEKTRPGTTHCALCSRLRRGILYTTARRLGATKIALGHHREDAVTTLLMNLFYSGQLKSMPPRLTSDDGRNVVIRPLAYCAEADVAELARSRGLPILPGGLCDARDDATRRRMAQIVDELQRDNPHVRSNALAALANVRPTHLYDRELLAAWRAATEPSTTSAEPADGHRPPGPMESQPTQDLAVRP